MSGKTYLGDGCYVRFDAVAEALVLTTEDGRSITNKIVLDGDVYGALLNFVATLKGAGAELRP